MEPRQDMGTSLDPNAHINSTSDRPQKTDEKKDSRSDSGEEDIPVSSMPGNDSKGPLLSVPGNSTGGSADIEKQSSQTQKSEEKGNLNLSISERIPSSVFASNANPMDWSTASNESLFSIYVGNVSFTDYSMYLDKPGETEPVPASASLNLSSSQPNVEGSHKDEDFQMNEARAADTMKEVLQENAEKSDRDKVAIAEAIPFGSTNRLDFSAVNTRSFAFKASTGSNGKSESPTANYKGQGKEVHAQPRQETEQDSSQSGPQTPRAQFSQSQKGWFSCFSCCSSRS